MKNPSEMIVKIYQEEPKVNTKTASVKIKSETKT